MCVFCGFEEIAQTTTQFGYYLFSLNPNTFAGLVGKVRKKLSPEGGRKGGWRKKARPPDPGLEPGTYRMLGEGPPLHARGAV